jgi:hypothetical protein
MSKKDDQDEYNKKLLKIIKEKRGEEYMGSKYSDHNFEQKETNGKDDHAFTQEIRTDMFEDKETYVDREMEKFWEEVDELEDSGKKHTYEDKKKIEKSNGLKEKLLTSTQMMEDLYPSNIIRSFKNITNLTPEEIETIHMIKRVNFDV